MVASNVIGIDYGESRVGVAIAKDGLRIARPLVTLINDQDLWQQLRELIILHEATLLVVGLPRNLNGDETPQTAQVRTFVGEAEQFFKLPIHLQDEALTSQKASQLLSTGKKTYEKPDIDAMAACLILTDYLEENH